MDVMTAPSLVAAPLHSGTLALWHLLLPSVHGYFRESKADKSYVMRLIQRIAKAMKQDFSIFFLYHYHYQQRYHLISNKSLNKALNIYNIPFKPSRPLTNHRTTPIPLNCKHPHICIKRTSKYPQTILPIPSVIPTISTKLQRPHPICPLPSVWGNPALRSPTPITFCTM